MTDPLFGLPSAIHCANDIERACVLDAILITRQSMLIALQNDPKRPDFPKIQLILSILSEVLEKNQVSCKVPGQEQN